MQSLQWKRNLTFINAPQSPRGFSVSPKEASRWVGANAREKTLLRDDSWRLSSRARTVGPPPTSPRFQMSPPASPLFFQRSPPTSPDGRRSSVSSHSPRGVSPCVTSMLPGDRSPLGSRLGWRRSSGEMPICTVDALSGSSPALLPRLLQDQCHSLSQQDIKLQMPSIGVPFHWTGCPWDENRSIAVHSRAGESLRRLPVKLNRI